MVAYLVKLTSTLDEVQSYLTYEPIFPPLPDFLIIITLQQVSFIFGGKMTIQIIEMQLRCRRILTCIRGPKN